MSLSRELMKRRRILMNLGRSGVLLGRYNYTAAQPALRDHSHRNSFEICFLVKGCQTYCLGDQAYRLRGGDIFLTRPGERHSTGGNPEERGVLYWMILSIPAFKKWSSGGLQKDIAALLRGLSSFKSPYFRGTWKMKECLDAITRNYHQKSNALTPLTLTNLAGEFLLEVVACGKRGAVPSTNGSLESVVQYIETHLEESLSVPRLAAEAGLSVARFKARFKTELGMPPGEYVLRAKIREAGRRLRESHEDVTKIALDLGFSTSQYFATVFRRFARQTPSEFRQSEKQIA